MILPGNILWVRTPNPCIRCNRYVKWEAMLNKCLALEQTIFATGHYARLSAWTMAAIL